MQADQRAPLAAAAARRHQLTRSRYASSTGQAPRSPSPPSPPQRASPGPGSTHSPTSGSRSAACATPRPSGPPPRSRPASGQPTHRCAPGSPPPSSATSNSPTKTHDSAASSPAHSATRDQPGPDPVTIQPPENDPDNTPAIASTTLSATRWPRSQPRLTLKLKITGGSYLALSHGPLDFHPPGHADGQADAERDATLIAQSRRSPECSAALFARYELIFDPHTCRFTGSQVIAAGSARRTVHVEICCARPG